MGRMLRSKDGTFTCATQSYDHTDAQELRATKVILPSLLFIFSISCQFLSFSSLHSSSYHISIPFPFC